jgi:hypothetical protein
VLMGKLAKRIGDRRVLRLIRRYLEAGMQANGVTTAYSGHRDQTNRVIVIAHSGAS